MPLSILVIISVGGVVAALIQCMGPLSFRPGIFFGVTVDPEFPGSESGRRILRRYRWPVIVMTGVCIAALWLAVPRLTGLAAPLVTSSLVFIQVGAAAISMALASRHVRPFAKPPSRIRTVSVIPRKRTLPGGWLPFAGPMLVVGAASLLLSLRQGSLPPETFRGAFALLLVPFVANAFFMWVAWLSIFRIRQISPGGAAANAEDADRRFGYVLRLLGAFS